MWAFYLALEKTKGGKDATKESNKSRKGNNNRCIYVHNPGRNHIALIIYYLKINFLKKFDRGTVDESCIEQVWLLSSHREKNSRTLANKIVYKKPDKNDNETAHHFDDKPG
jgi:hypothetical protein